MIVKFFNTSALSILLAFTLSALPTKAQAWGQIGHRIIGEIADRNLDPKARAALQKILGEETLAEISTWADDIRSSGEWDMAGPWHYISIDDDETWDDFERVPEDEGDLLRILDTLEKFLSDPEKETLTLKGKIKSRGTSLTPRKEKTIGKRDALAFYIHFLGDLHQPLHVGRREDQGGNKIQVEWFEEEFSLHKVWDEKLIESVKLSYTEFADFLNRGTEAERKIFGEGSYLDWAKEAKEVREKVYDFGAQRSSYFINVVEPPSLSYGYRHQVMPIVRDRLQKGGFRLAAKLNAFFSAYPEN